MTKAKWREKWKATHLTPVTCIHRERDHYGNGLCRPCWFRDYYARQKAKA